MGVSRHDDSLPCPNSPRWRKRIPPSLGHSLSNSSSISSSSGSTRSTTGVHHSLLHKPGFCNELGTNKQGGSSSLIRSRGSSRRVDLQGVNLGEKTALLFVPSWQDGVNLEWIQLYSQPPAFFSAKYKFGQENLRGETEIRYVRPRASSPPRAKTLQALGQGQKSRGWVSGRLRCGGCHADTV
jgi:hypothetical protein